MIKEDYCSFEVAKLLKEKGFDEPIWTCYEDNNEVIFGDKYNWNNSPMGHTSAPTLQMAMKWLRKKHNIMIEIYLPHEYEHEEEIWDGKYCFELFSLTSGHSMFWDETEYNTYEEAVEAACLYSLKNLI